MQAAYIWHQFHIHRRKAIILLLACLCYASVAQNNTPENLINYDEQWIHYGFLLGLHSSKYVIRYSDTFTTPAQDTVHSIIPGNLGGFKLGFIANMRLSNYLDFRGSVTIGFYENDLLYRFTDNTSLRELKDATMVEFPLLLKYKSVRRGNLAAYLLGGVKPSFEAAGRGDQGDEVEALELRNWDVAIEIGGGLDIYNTFFKFSPELRYSYGLRNMLADERNEFSVGLDRLTTQNITLFLTFEGGPTPKGTRRKTKVQKIKSRQNKSQKQFRHNQ